MILAALNSVSWLLLLEVSRIPQHLSTPLQDLDSVTCAFKRTWVCCMPSIDPLHFGHDLSLSSITSCNHMVKPAGLLPWKSEDQSSCVYSICLFAVNEDCSRVDGSHVTGRIIARTHQGHRKTVGCLLPVLRPTSSSSGIRYGNCLHLSSISSYKWEGWCWLPRESWKWLLHWGSMLNAKKLRSLGHSLPYTLLPTPIRRAYKGWLQVLHQRASLGEIWNAYLSEEGEYAM